MPTTFPCRAGVRRESTGTVAYIVSPRTGVELRLPYADTRAKAVTRKLAAASATGRHTVDFTRDELHAFADAATNPIPVDVPDTTARTHRSTLVVGGRTVNVTAACSYKGGWVVQPPEATDAATGEAVALSASDDDVIFARVERELYP